VSLTNLYDFNVVLLGAQLRHGEEYKQYERSTHSQFNVSHKWLNEGHTNDYILPLLVQSSAISVELF
jgi:hypothetical protein